MDQTCKELPLEKISSGDNTLTNKRKFGMIKNIYLYIKDNEKLLPVFINNAEVLVEDCNSRTAKIMDDNVRKKVSKDVKDVIKTKTFNFIERYKYLKKAKLVIKNPNLLAVNHYAFNKGDNLELVSQNSEILDFCIELVKETGLYAIFERAINDYMVVYYNSDTKNISIPIINNQIKDYIMNPDITCEVRLIPKELGENIVRGNKNEREHFFKVYNIR